MQRKAAISHMSEHLDCAYEDAQGHDGAGATRRMALVCMASSSAGNSADDAADRSVGSSADSSGNNAADLLLSDFHDALLAYTRLSVCESEEPQYPSFVRAECTPTGSLRILEQPGHEEAGLDFTGCDTVVLAFEVASPSDCEPLGCALRALTNSCALKPATSFYAIICDSCSSMGDTAAREAVCICRQVDARWSGAVVVTDARLVPHLIRAPRLGMWRRPVSQAIDRLVAAVRMGCALGELDGLLGVEPGRADTSNVLVASPHPLWRAVASRMR